MTTRSRRPNAIGLNTVSNEDGRHEPPLLTGEAGTRANLEALRDILIDRLSRRSDDFDATRDLRLVYSKLQQTSYGEQTVTTSS
jgi:hypothetical protein